MGVCWKEESIERGVGTKGGWERVNMIKIHMDEVTKIRKPLGRCAWIVGESYDIIYKELVPLTFGVRSVRTLKAALHRC